jgi:hypothetical protein
MTMVVSAGSAALDFRLAGIAPACWLAACKDVAHRGVGQIVQLRLQARQAFQAHILLVSDLDQSACKAG